MKRVPGEMRLQHTNEVIKVRVFLHDISPGGVGLFCERAVEIGSKVDLVLEVPKHLFVRGTVVWCAEAGVTSHVISTETFHYRAGLTFQFDSKGAEDEFKKYCDEIAHLKPVNQGPGT